MKQIFFPPQLQCSNCHAQPSKMDETERSQWSFVLKYIFSCFSPCKRPFILKEKKKPTFWAVILNRSCEPLPKDVITLNSTFREGTLLFGRQIIKRPQARRMRHNKLCYYSSLWFYQFHKPQNKSPQPQGVAWLLPKCLSLIDAMINKMLIHKIPWWDKFPAFYDSFWSILVYCWGCGKGLISAI